MPRKQSQFDEAACLKQAARDEVERKIGAGHPSDAQLAREDQ